MKVSIYEEFMRWLYIIMLIQKIVLVWCLGWLMGVGGSPIFSSNYNLSLVNQFATLTPPL